MMKAVLLAAVVVGAAAMDMPLYCRLLQKGLEMATFNPIIADANISDTTHVTGLGDIAVSASHLEISSATVVDCAASIDENGVFNVGLKRLDLHLSKLDWAYNQKSWPHIWDKGTAKGNTSISFNVSIDTNADKQKLFNIRLAEFSFDLGAQHHKWLTKALMKLTKMLRPIVSELVHVAAKKTLEDSLDIIHSKGGCAFIHNVLAGVDMTTISFQSDNNTVHVPVVGNVEMSVDSKWVSQPTTMDCKSVGFTGKTLVAHIENVPFSAGFAWSYRKAGSKFWHNHGNGSTSIVGGTELHIDLLDPSKTVLKVDLPVLELKLHAAADAWLYDAMTGIMVPLVHETLTLFGGKILTHYVRKCLEDPTCPHLHPHPQFNLPEGSSRRRDTTESSSRRRDTIESSSRRRATTETEIVV